MKAILVFILSMSLTACIVVPKKGFKKGRVKQVKVITKLDSQHQDKSIVVVSAKPNKKRNCWSHGQHWHCSNK